MKKCIDAPLHGKRERAHACARFAKWQPLLEGVLHKRATKGGVRWATRYFRLFSNRLMYSLKAKGCALLALQPLEGSRPKICLYNVRGEAD